MRFECLSTDTTLDVDGMKSSMCNGGLEVSIN